MTDQFALATSVIKARTIAGLTEKKNVPIKWMSENRG
jgi:hypothetical protein